MLNLKQHTVVEKATGLKKELCLQFEVQLHRGLNDTKVDQFYLMQAHGMFPLEETLRHISTSELTPAQMLVRQLRPEHSIAHHRPEADLNLQYFTWDNPQRCHECHNVIQTYQYFHYEKRSPENRLLVDYYCCLDCF